MLTINNKTENYLPISKQISSCGFENCYLQAIHFKTHTHIHTHARTHIYIYIYCHPQTDCLNVIPYRIPECSIRSIGGVEYTDCT